MSTYDIALNTKQPIVKDITDFVWDCRDLGIMHMAEVTQCIVGRLLKLGTGEEDRWQPANLLTIWCEVLSAKSFLVLRIF